MHSSPGHQCVIYEGSPAKHLSGMAALMVGKLKANNRCVYFNSPTMVTGMRSHLAASGLNVEQEMAKGSLVLSSDRGHLVGGKFDVGRMLGIAVDALDQALDAGYHGLWGTGDIVWEFGSEENLSKLLEYEFGLDEAFRKRPAWCGLCQYHQDALPDEVVQSALFTHESVFINETLARLNPYYSPPEFQGRVPRTTNHLQEMLNRLRLSTLL